MVQNLKFHKFYSEIKHLQSAIFLTSDRISTLYQSYISSNYEVIEPDGYLLLIYAYLSIQNWVKLF